MSYRKAYINRDFGIRVFTNSKAVLRLVDNFLDFNGARILRSNLKIDFYLNEVKDMIPNDEKNQLFQSCLEENKKLWLSIGNRVANVKVDPKARLVNGSILNYQQLHKERLLDLIFIQPLCFILAHYGLFFLHASVVCKGKDSILINGPQGSGKSTLALALSRNGFNLLADDDCFVKSVRNQTRLFPFPTKIGLKNNVMLNRYPELDKYVMKNYCYRGKRRLSLTSASPNVNGAKGYRCKMIIFPKYQARRNIYMNEISKKEALDRLVRANLPEKKRPNGLVKDISPTHKKKNLKRCFGALCNLTRTANLFELVYNDDRLDEVPGMIQKVFKS